MAQIGCARLAHRSKCQRMDVRSATLVCAAGGSASALDAHVWLSVCSWRCRGQVVGCAWTVGADCAAALVFACNLPPPASTIDPFDLLPWLHPGVVRDRYSPMSSGLGAAYGTAKSGVGVANMGVMHPDVVMKSIIPVVMAGVLGIYGLIVAVLLASGSECARLPSPCGH